jgi:hypothetical protein
MFVCFLGLMSFVRCSSVAGEARLDFREQCYLVGHATQELLQKTPTSFLFWPQRIGRWKRQKPQPPRNLRPPSLPTLFWACPQLVRAVAE